MRVNQARNINNFARYLAWRAKWNSMYQNPKRRQDESPLCWLGMNYMIESTNPKVTTPIMCRRVVPFVEVGRTGTSYIKFAVPELDGNAR